MARLRLTGINSTDGLRAAAREWDDLWWRSDVTIPTARAELVAQWLERFAPQAEFRALVVEQGGRWVAALPLVRLTGHHAGIAGAIHDRTWIPGGALLLDGKREVAPALEALVAGMRGFASPGLWLLFLNHVALEAPRWKDFREALGRLGMPNHVDSQHEVGLFEINHDWEACQRTWPSKHRTNIGRRLRRLADHDLRVEMYSDVQPDQVEALVQRGFEIEDRSWKGEAGSSVIRRGELPFFTGQAKQLAAWGQFAMGLLELDGVAIAFEYAFLAKGVYHAYKISYDPAYATHGPGQVLRYFVLERLHRDPSIRMLDTLGPLTEATCAWNPLRYTMGNMVIAPSRWFGRSVLCAYRHGPPVLARLRSLFRRR
jgi:hypothetical protein